MYSAYEFILNILKSVLTSILISIIFLIFSYSFFTGKFPPNLKEFRDTFKSIQQLSKASIENIQRIQQQNNKISQEQVLTGEANVIAVQEYQRQRAQIGDQINQLASKKSLLENLDPEVIIPKNFRGEGDWNLIQRELQYIHVKMDSIEAKLNQALLNADNLNQKSIIKK